MTQEELPLEFEPYPGYWRVTIWNRLGEPPMTVWFEYDQKHIAEELARQAYEQLDWKKPLIELDTEFTPAEDDDDDDDEEKPWYLSEWY